MLFIGLSFDTYTLFHIIIASSVKVSDTKDWQDEVPVLIPIMS